MPDRIVYHVTPTEKGWSLQPEGRPSEWTYFTTKEEAVRAGSAEAATHEQGQLIVHDREGRIEEERTYGEDPRRTRG